ncbi:MAG: type VI secretion system protein TssA [Pyrinomonadaceae bacterium]|nr:type VI secretion system protein TssA [Pyrinomonadaceae bacterium]
MSEENQESKFPPVIDLDAIMQPISEENPAGESTRYSGLYDEIIEARRADDMLAQGEWQTDVKYADFKKVIDLAVPALISQTKDLQIAAYLTEALVKEYQFAGLRDSMKLMSGLQENFWDSMFPEIEDGDMEGRANAIAFLDSQAADAIKEAKITQGQGYSLIDWEDSKKFAFPDNVDTLDTADQQRYAALRAQAEKENRVTEDLWNKAIIASRRAFYEDLALIIAECWEAYNDINRVIEEKFDPKQMPGMTNLKKALETVQTQVEKLLAQKREEEPDEVEEEADEGETQDSGGAVSGGQSGMPETAGAIQGRADALKRLAQLAEFFRKTEPHSPISYLVTRAVKWGNMPLETWLQDVIKDETVLFQIRQTLGFNTGVAPENPEYDPNAQENW